MQCIFSIVSKDDRCRNCSLEDASLLKIDFRWKQIRIKLFKYLVSGFHGAGRRSWLIFQKALESVGSSNKNIRGMAS